LDFGRRLKFSEGMMRETGIQIANLASENFYERKGFERRQQENVKHSKS
jgi:hypothetical protein